MTLGGHPPCRHFATDRQRFTQSPIVLRRRLLTSDSGHVVRSLARGNVTYRDCLLRERRTDGNRGLKVLVWAVLVLAITLVMVVLPQPPALADSAVNAPRLAPTPINKTTTSISVRFYRSPDPDLVCKPDIGYELRGGAFADWRDVGGFPNAPCDDPDLGYKFSGLTPATTDVLSIRAYRLVAGVKDSYSPESSITASTLAQTPSPTPSATASPTATDASSP
jgi:hypothetical protein